MKDWQDMQGFNKLKECYQTDKISLANDHISFGSLKITKQELYSQGLDSNFGAEQTKQPSNMIEIKDQDVKSEYDGLRR